MLSIIAKIKFKINSKYSHEHGQAVKFKNYNQSDLGRFHSRLIIYKSYNKSLKVLPLSHVGHVVNEL